MTDDIAKYLRLSQNRFNRHAEAADYIESVIASRDHYRRVAEEAVANLEQAVRLLETMQKAMHE